MIDYGRLDVLFRQVDATAVADCDKSLRTITSGLQLRSASPRICGPAFTVHARGDFFAVARAIETAPPGSVIVVDGAGEEIALSGELFARAALVRGLAGIVVDGAVRDRVYLRSCPLPVYSRYVTPMAGTTQQLGELEVPVTCGGVAVHPGDTVLADGEGVLVIDPADALRLVEAALVVKQTEARAVRLIDAGGTLSDCLTVREHEAALTAGRASTLAFRTGRPTARAGASARPATSGAGASPSAICDVRLADGSRVDVLVDGEQIMSVEPSGERPAGESDGVVDGRGGLLLPAFIDTHVHLDKAGIRDRLDETRRHPGSAHPGDLAWAIAATHQAKRAYTIEEVSARAEAVIERHVLHGTTRIRTHVDVDTIGGLTPLRGVQAAARACADIADVVTIAFPQEGITRDPGAASLMVAAMEAGADVVGGMPHWESGEAAQREHVRFCFDLAERFDADVDLHVDETDDGGIRTLSMVVTETERRGWQGRVTVGHVCALAAADDAYADDVIAGCARAGVTVASNPVTNLVLQGRGDRGLVRRGTTRIREFLAAGVPVAFGQDCVRDAFYPFGRASMLEVALISAHAAHLTTSAELRTALDAVTAVPAQAWRLGGRYGVTPGARADLQLYAAPTWEAALADQDPPTHVWRAGRLVASTSVSRQIRPR